MARLNPLWVDVTWGAGGSSAELTQELCENFGKFTGLDVLMHLTCTNVTDSDFFILSFVRIKELLSFVAR